MTRSPATGSRQPVLGVGAVIWNDQDEIVLIRRGKEPRRDQWSIPGGHLEWGESLHEALLREVKERTALTVEVVALIDAVVLTTEDAAENVPRHYVLIDFAVRAVGGNLRAGSDAAEARWIRFSDLNEYA